MGTWYYARLLWGIKINKSKAKSGEFSEEQDQIDEQWDDIETWCAENAKDTFNGIRVQEIPYCYDGIEPDEAGFYIFPKELSFRTEMYSFMEIKFPQFNEAEMIVKLKAACKGLGVKYGNPKWYLMVESH